MNKLKIGDKAPAFQGIDQNGNIIKSESLIGNKLILYFYPTDDTPGCTAEACNLRDNYSILLKKGFNIIGVSKDNESSHKKFSTKHSLPFPLIADTDKKILNEYGVWGEKKFMGRINLGTHRTTFIISEDWTIEKIIEKVDTKNHTEQILKELNL